MTSSAAPAPPAAVPDRLRTAAIGTAVTFGVSGAVFASWVSRLPAVRDSVGATEATLGLALLAPGLGSLTTMPVTGRLCLRYGSRRVVTALALPAVAVLGLIAFMPSVPALAVTLLVWGAFYGAWDVAMNIQGSEVERRAARAWMPRYHACWSVGGFVGAGAGALLAYAGLPVRAHLPLAAAVSAVTLLLAVRTFVDDRAAPPADDATDRAPGARLLSPRLVGVGAITLCATLSEGAAADWLAIFLTDERQASASAAAAGYTAFAVAMAVARFAGTSVIEALGRVLALRAAGVLTAVGVAVTILTPGLAGGYAGAVLWGLGVAIVFPAAMSAAGDTPGRSSDAIAAVSTIGYAGFLLGPPAIGFLAAGVGLGVALSLVVVMAAAVVVLAGAARQGRAP